MVDEKILFEELEEITVPVSDFSAGVATGIGIGLGIIALTGC